MRLRHTAPFKLNMTTYLYKILYVLLVGALVIASLFVYFAGHTERGMRYALFAESGQSSAPALLVGVRQVAGMSGDTVLAVGTGPHATELEVRGTARAQGALLYVGDERAVAAAEAPYRLVLSLPYLGVVLEVLSSLWGRLALVGVPLLMLATHAVLVLHYQASMTRSPQLNNFGRTMRSPRLVVLRDTLRTVPEPAAYPWQSSRAMRQTA